MSANKSNLSSSQFGYDFVVATTQASINATMKAFLDSLPEPEVAICYIADAGGKATAIDYDTLKKNANGSDPFAIPSDADPATNPDLLNLAKARFMAGFKAQIGLPPGVLPKDLPAIVILGSDTAAVTYNLLCAEFIVVQYTPGNAYNPTASWMSQSQPPDSPWIFTSKVDLRLSVVDKSDYSKLSPDMQAGIKNLGESAFSVQQLLFDMDNAALETVPKISGVDVGSLLYSCLQQYFLGKYFSVMQQKQAPVLGGAIRQNATDSASLRLTDMNIEVNPFMAANRQPVLNPSPQQQQLSTLNYLCAANGNQLPPAAHFTWNWVDTPAQQMDHHGVVAIKRDAFLGYFRSRLDAYVSMNCNLASASASLHGVKVKFKAGLENGQQPTVDTPATGPVILSYSYASSAKDKARNSEGKIELDTKFTLKVTFSGNTIVIEQYQYVYLLVGLEKAHASGIISEGTITDTYTLLIDDRGQLLVKQDSVLIPGKEDIKMNAFENYFDRSGKIFGDIDRCLKGFVNTEFNNLPLSLIQHYVFPGGRTFAFKDVCFSEFQDLVSYITYVSPS